MRTVAAWVGIVTLFLLVAIPVLGLLGSVWFGHVSPGGFSG